MIKDVLRGFIGLYLEIYYTFFKPIKMCEKCGKSFSGYYCNKYMNYCHTCGEELIEKPAILNF